MLNRPAAARGRKAITATTIANAIAAVAEAIGAAAVHAGTMNTEETSGAATSVRPAADRLPIRAAPATPRDRQALAPRRQLVAHHRPRLVHPPTRPCRAG